MAGECLSIYSHLLWLLGERNVPSQQLPAAETHPCPGSARWGLPVSCCSLLCGTRDWSCCALRLGARSFPWLQAGWHPAALQPVFPSPGCSRAELSEEQSAQLSSSACTECPQRCSPGVLLELLSSQMTLVSSNTVSACVPALCSPRGAAHGFSSLHWSFLLMQPYHPLQCASCEHSENKKTPCAMGPFCCPPVLLSSSLSVF